jgi:Na+/proline symporter
MAMIMTLVVLLAVTGFVWSRSSLYGKPTIESFLVSNRNIPFGLGAITLSASWTQAIALVVGATFAYMGPWNFMWFCIPNILVLVFMAFLAPKIQEAMPQGYTLPQVVGQAFGPGVRTLFFLSAIGSLIYIISVTMTALAQWIGQQLNIPVWAISIVIGGFSFLWVVRRGLPQAVIGDVVKMILIGALIIGVIALHINYAGVITAEVFVSKASPGTVFWNFGVALAVTLFGSVVCSPDIAERAYAVDRRNVRRSYLGAAVLFAVIVLVFGSVGFLAKGLGISVSNTQPAALAVLQATVSPGAILIVTVMFVVLLTAGLATMLASAGDILVIEFYRRFINPDAGDERVVHWSRVFIALAVLSGTLIAAFNPDLSLLIQNMAVIRGEAVIPLFLALFWPKIASGRYVFWGMLLGVIGGVVLVCGTLYDGALWQNVFGSPMPFLVANGKPLGALVAFFAPLATCLLAFLMRQVNGSVTKQIVDVKT